MRVGVVLIGFITLVASAIAVAELLKDRASPQPDKPAAETPEVIQGVTDSEGHFFIAKTGPYPKAVLSEQEYNFDRMEIGEERSHTFTIRNEGEAPLLIKKGPATCQCTVGEFPKDAIEPGSSADIVITWKPRAEAESFNKRIEVWTNDPKNQFMEIRIDGTVTSQLVTYPAGLWEINQVKEGEPTDVSGIVASPIADQFEITALESDDPRLSAVAEKIERVEDLQSINGRSGYKVTVTLQPDLPVGEFNLPLRIRTSLQYRSSGEPVVSTVLIRGNRQGPIKFSGGPNWIQARSLVSLGLFEAREGSKVTLTMLVSHPPAEGFQLREGGVECDPPELKVSLERDEKFTHKVGRYFLHVEYPAGSPRVMRTDDNPGRIKIRTNHPAAPDIDLWVVLKAT